MAINIYSPLLISGISLFFIFIIIIIIFISIRFNSSYINKKITDNTLLVPSKNQPQTVSKPKPVPKPVSSQYNSSYNSTKPTQRQN